MALQNLRGNIQEEREMVGEMLMFVSQLPASSGKERELIMQTVNALLSMMRMINNSIPSILENISPIKALGKEKEVREAKNLVSLNFEKGGKEKEVTINEVDRKAFMEDLRKLDFSVKKIRKPEKEIVFSEFKKPSNYARISNKFFLRLSNSLVEKRYFDGLSNDLRRANMPFIINTYTSMMLFSVMLSIVLAIFAFALLLFFKLGIDFPFLTPYQANLGDMAKNLLICVIIPVLTFIGFYYYPYTERQSIGKRIERELPFVVIHMSAIAGSGIEPTQIFKIIVMEKEYPYMKQEIRKVMNQVNFFGYDLVSALRNSGKSAPSNKLSELFNGLATTISSGGSMPEFLDKRAETLLIDYKLERESSTKMAESFMDIYISVVIAAPMIMMLLMILMSVGIVNLGLGIGAMTLIIIAAVALINLLFLGFLQLKQTTY
jgi:hypothetical protein